MKVFTVTISIFMVAATGQAFAGASEKYCIAHNNKSGGVEYTVQTESNAVKHCYQHDDVQVPKACCEPTKAKNLKDITEVNLGACGDGTCP